MNRFGTALLTTALALSATTQLASASVLNDLIDANRRRGGSEIEFTERQALTANRPQIISSVLNDLVDENRRRAGNEINFNERQVQVSSAQTVASLQDILEENRRFSGQRRANIA